MPPKRRNYLDDYQTPEYAVEPLIPYLKAKGFKVVWECACGRGYLVKALKKYGFEVIASDIIYGQDFLKWMPDRDFDCIVTNPPYSIRYEFIKRCYEIGKPFALLMTLTTLEGRRQQLFEKYGIELLLLNKRVDFITPNGKGSGSWFPVAWFCWKILPKQICFGKIHKRKFM